MQLASDVGPQWEIQFSQLKDFLDLIYNQVNQVLLNMGISVEIKGSVSSGGQTSTTQTYIQILTELTSKMDTIISLFQQLIGNSVLP
jgi:hypothetical protein